VPEDPDGRLANLLGALALAIADQLTAAVEAASGMTDAAPAALTALHESSTSGRSIDDLRRLVGLTHSGAVRLVDRLVASGHIERGPGATGRSVGLTLTARGAEVAALIREARQAVVGIVLSQLDVGARGQLVEFCETMIATVTAQRLAARQAGVEIRGGALCRLCDFAACGRPDGNCPAATAAAEHVPAD